MIEPTFVFSIAILRFVDDGPTTVVNRLRALREPDETFSDVILRLAERGCYAAIAR
jgi:hypothetical protein